MAPSVVLSLSGLQSLIDELRSRGRRVIGPTLRDSAVVLTEVESVTDLPRGVVDEQAPGHYRATRGSGEAVFGYAAAVASAKEHLFPPDELLWRGTRRGATFEVEAGSAATEDASGPQDPRPTALLGLRACDLAAIAVHDEVLLARASADARYAARRVDTFLVAVTCATPAGTCFCASMGTGPRPGPGADLVLTELVDCGEHRFLAEPGSPAGAELLAALPSRPATPDDVQAAAELVAGAVARMGRQLATEGLRDLLYASAESPHWAAVGQRCLSCTNCTMVCPTCFCTSIEDVSDLSGDTDERHRVWDSCFSLEYSHLHGGAVRTSAGSRYRQWLTHKLGSWTDQFGMSGCVGCGRCITWCPVGIDLTEEVAALRQEAAARPAQPDSARHGTVPSGPPLARHGTVPPGPPSAGPVSARTATPRT